MLHCCRLPLPALGRALQLHRITLGPSGVCERICPVHALYRVTGSLCSSSHQVGDGGGCSSGAGDGPASDASACPLSTPALQRHRRRRRGSLSPLERLSQLIPAELLSEEVADLRVTAKEHSANTSFISSQSLPVATEHPLIEEQMDPHRTSPHQHPAEGQHSMDEKHVNPVSIHPTHHGTTNPENEKPNPENEKPNRSPHGLSQPLTAGAQPLVDGHQGTGSNLQTLHSGVKLPVNEIHRTPHSKSRLPTPRAEACSEPIRDEGHSQDSSLAAQWHVFKIGDLCLAEFRRKYYLEFKKMFTLAENNKLLSNWGLISHREIIGSFPGQMLKTSIGFPLLFRRPTLEDFVLFMKRGPTISYPKDSHAMLAMMDVNPGDTILEAGSGSGGMSLFLSRAVGSEGRVLSFEVRNDHHRVAKRNYQRWRDAWEIGHGQKWPDNVEFINKDVCAADAGFQSVTFDAVALDMLTPQVALPVLFPSLKPGAICAVYLANITQVIDLLEGIRFCQLSLLCEKITEVIHKDWLVIPSKQKDGSISQRVAPKHQAQVQEEKPLEDEDSDTEAEPSSNEVMPFGSVPYVARPFPWQTGHTAFLVKLRKFQPASGHLVSHNSSIPIDGET